MLRKIGLFLTSRSFWVYVVVFLLNGIAAIHNAIPANVVGGVDVILGLLAAYFHVNPSRNYSAGDISDTL